MISKPAKANREGPPQEANNLAGKLTQELARLEKRDWDLWMIVALSTIVGSCTLLYVLFPSTFFQQGYAHLEITISKPLFFVLLAIMMLINTYLLTRRADLRQVRHKLVTTAIQSELIRLQSFTDPLTEIYNRRSLDELASRFISHARRAQEPVTFLMLDVDRFKEVNTRFGHITGDYVLSEIAGVLRSATRGSDAVVRYGGDEFLIVLAQTSPQSADVVVQRISDLLASWNKDKHLEDFVLTISVGVAGWSDGDTLDEVLDAADRDMYARKQGAQARN